MAEDNKESESKSSPEAVVLTIAEDKHTNPSDEKKTEAAPKKNSLHSEKSIKIRYISHAVSLITFLLAFPLLFEAIWLLYVEEYSCEGLLRTLPKLQIGIAVGLILMFFLSNAIVRIPKGCLGPGLIVVMIPLVVMFIVGLSLGGGLNAETRQVPGSPEWLKARVFQDSHWERIKSCIYTTGICKDLRAKASRSSTPFFVRLKVGVLQAAVDLPDGEREHDVLEQERRRGAKRGVRPVAEQGVGAVLRLQRVQGRVREIAGAEVVEARDVPRRNVDAAHDLSCPPLRHQAFRQSHRRLNSLNSSQRCKIPDTVFVMLSFVKK